jgi:hypothetical protein
MQDVIRSTDPPWSVGWQWLMAGYRLTKDQEDYLEALSTFIEQYENKADPEPKKKTPVTRFSGISARRTE